MTLLGRIPRFYRQKLTAYFGALLAIALLVSFAAPSFANSNQDIRELIRTGNYAQAYDQAAQLDTVDGYVLAAESLSTQILLGEINKLNRRSKDARELAKTALELSPSSYEARLQYVLSDGFVTRSSGNLTAWRKKLPEKTYRNIQAFRRDYPDDARAMALEAAWHMGIIRKTGEKAGMKWFKASGQVGTSLYQQAIARAPNNIIIRINYVMSKLALSTPPDMEKMKMHLDAIEHMPARNDVDKKLKLRAQAVYHNLDDLKQAKTLAEQFLDGK